VAQAAIRPGELVLDIGAGHGALTGPLVAAGARVIAVELDAGRAEQLRRRFAADPVTVLPIDAADLRLPRRPFRVVANPPFAITSLLLRALLARGSAMVGADLVLQRAAVSRYASATITRRWHAEMGLRLTRTAFHPVPTVDAAVLRLRR
jgi:23S rRNA (adenine-N6)-dimethyltransferase